MGVYYNIMVNGYREHTLAPDCKTKAEARKYGNRRKTIIKAMFDGLIPMDDKVKEFAEKLQNKNKPTVEIYTVGFLCNAIIKDYKKQENKTLNKIETHSVFFKDFFGEDLDIKTIDDYAIKDMINELKTHKNKKGELISTTTVNRYMSTLRRAFNILKKNKEVDIWMNPCEDTKAYPEKPKEKKIVPPERMSEFLSYLPQPQRDMVELDFNIGLRFTNIFKLNKTQIDLKNDRINIAPEDNKSKKWIKKKINKKAKEIIQKYYKDHEHYLFVHKDEKYKGLPFSSIKRSWATAAKAIGIPELTPHDARRSFGTRIYKKTKDIYLTMEALDHSDPKVTKAYVITEASEVDKTIDNLYD